MAKIEIALCITDLDVGGAERAVADLATHLDRDRFEPVVYCLGPWPEVRDRSCVPALQAAGIEVECLGATRNREVFSVVGRLRRLLERRRPALVQSFLFHANLVGRIAARRAGVRRVVSSIRVAEPRHWHLWADRWTAGLVDRYVCVSEAVARFSAARAGLPVEKLVVIPNGIDVDQFSARSGADLTALGVAVGRRLVTYVGRLDRQKGVRWLLQAAPGWLRRLPDCDLLLVGEGPERSRLERLCQKRGISDRVHFAGWRSDVAEILAASRLLVLPSRWEGMPNVVLQAMASRLPVLASDVEGVRELLGPDAEPQTIGYRDSRGLVEKIVRLMSDRDFAGELGLRNRRRARQEFAIERVVAAYEDLWASLTAG